MIDIDDLLLNSKISFLIDKKVKKEYYYNDYISESEVIKAYKKYSISNKNDSEVVPINEMTLKDIKLGADKPRIQRSKDSRIVCRYVGVTNSRGWLKFDVTSQFIKGKHYIVYIKLVDAKDIKYFKEFNKRDIIRLILSGDLKVHCSCPDFRYRMKYQAWSMGYGIFKELRYPHIVNPGLTGTVCKHILAVFQVLNMNWMKIAKSVEKSKFYKNKFEESEDDKGKKGKLYNRGRVKV